MRGIDHEDAHADGAALFRAEPGDEFALGDGGLTVGRVKFDGIGPDEGDDAAPVPGMSLGTSLLI